MVQQQQQPKNNDPLYVEFTHIEINSCVVQVGDAVKKGHLLCRSGSVGFCPEPHLHFAAYRTSNATVHVKFEWRRKSSIILFSKQWWTKREREAGKQQQEDEEIQLRRHVCPVRVDGIIDGVLYHRMICDELIERRFCCLRHCGLIAPHHSIHFNFNRLVTRR